MLCRGAWIQPKTNSGYRSSYVIRVERTNKIENTLACHLVKAGFYGLIANYLCPTGQQLSPAYGSAILGGLLPRLVQRDKFISDLLCKLVMDGVRGWGRVFCGGVVVVF